MATPITTNQLRKELDKMYAEIFTELLLIMPRRGKYQVWQGHKLVADKIKHRREALAVMKLLKENEDGTS